MNMFENIGGISRSKVNFITENAKTNSTLGSDGMQKFSLAAEAEKKNGKDLCFFTKEQVEELYKSDAINTPSLEYLMMINSLYARYTDWCIKKRLILSGENAYRKFSYDDLLACLNKDALNGRIISRSDLLNVCNSLANVSDSCLLLALFEGIYGDSYSELVALESNQISGKIVSLSSGRELEISDVLVDYIQKSCKEYTYYCYAEDGGVKQRPYDVTDDRAFKRMYNARYKDNEPTITSMHRMRLKLLRIKQNYGDVEFVNSTSLMESGRIEMIKKFMAEDRSNDVRETYAKHKEEIDYRYGEIIGFARWMKKYGNLF